MKIGDPVRCSLGRRSHRPHNLEELNADLIAPDRRGCPVQSRSGERIPLFPERSEGMSISEPRHKAGATTSCWPPKRTLRWRRSKHCGPCQTLTVGRFLHRRHGNRQTSGSSTNTYKEAAAADTRLVSSRDSVVSAGAAQTRSPGVSSGQTNWASVLNTRPIGWRSSPSTAQ